MDQVCLFTDHFNQFSVKFVSQNFPFFRIFVWRETTKFLVTLQALQFTDIFFFLLLNGTLFYCIWISFWARVTVLLHTARVFHTGCCAAKKPSRSSQVLCAATLYFIWGLVIISIGDIIPLPQKHHPSLSCRLLLKSVNCSNPHLFR